MAKKKENQYYSLTEINKKKAQYNVIFGERSNGKTYAVLNQILENYVKKGEKGAYIRRYREDMRGLSAQMLFAGIVANGVIEKLTDGMYNTVTYYQRKWYLAHIEESAKPNFKDTAPFCYSFALTESKGSNYPGITTFHFDEFIERRPELPGEFELLMNLISTVARDKANMKIYLTANTVNQSSLYFREFGLTNVKKMHPGQIDVYQYGNSKLKCAVEYTAHKVNKESDVYFAFNNPHLEMIKTGAWEIGVYPHTTERWTKDKVILSVFLKYEDEVLQLDFVSKDDVNFIYVHQKTTEIHDENRDIILSGEDNPRPNVIHSLTKSNLRIAKRILWFLNNKKIYYQDNSVGEVMRNWLINTGDMRYLKV